MIVSIRQNDASIHVVYPRRACIWRGTFISANEHVPGLKRWTNQRTGRRNMVLVIYSDVWSWTLDEKGTKVMPCLISVQMFKPGAVTLCQECCDIVSGVLWHCVRRVVTLCQECYDIVSGELWHCIRSVVILCQECCDILWGMLWHCVRKVLYYKLVLAYPVWTINTDYCCLYI